MIAPQNFLGGFFRYPATLYVLIGALFAGSAVYERSAKTERGAIEFIGGVGGTSTSGAIGGAVFISDGAGEASATGSDDDEVAINGNINGPGVDGTIFIGESGGPNRSNLRSGVASLVTGTTERNCYGVGPSGGASAIVQDTIITFQVTEQAGHYEDIDMTGGNGAVGDATHAPGAGGVIVITEGAMGAE